MIVSRVPGRRPVLVVWRHGTTEPSMVGELEHRLTHRLTRLYRPWVGGEPTVCVRSAPAAGTTIATVEEAPGRSELGELVVWGDPVGARGPATDAELTSATDDDTAARDLIGSFALARLGDNGVVVRNGADLIHTLKHVTGPHGEAWATQGLAALVATGRRPVIVPERIPEFVVYDFVFGDDELLDGVRVLPEATRVSISATGATESTYWPEGQRLRGGSGDADAIVAAASSLLTRIVARDDLQLALTAGRDSTLLAGCLAGLGVALPSFTFGNAGTPDGAGAAAVAAHLGWPHRFVEAPSDADPSVDRLLAMTRWSEGMDTAWNFYSPPLRWPADSGTAHMYGIAGEMGRAFYWAGITDARLLDDPAAAMAEWHASRFAEPGASAILDRARGFADQLYADGWRGTGIFDGWHARGRVRKWPSRTPPPAGISVYTVYTSAPVARVLLGVAPPDRASKAAFDEAGRRAGDLRTVALGAVGALPPPSRWARSRPGRVLRRTLRPDPGVAWVDRCLRELGTTTPLAVDVLGADWWARMKDSAARGRSSAHQLWMVLAVEALRRVADDVGKELAGR